MEMARVLKLLFAAVMVSVIHGGKWVSGAPANHVVGGDRGWDSSSGVGSWSSGRTFRVGDKIWFAYSASLENIVELQGLEEFLSCDVTNPIRKFTDGLDSISLEAQGTRYFASGNPDSCKNGLKLHVEVQSQIKDETSKPAALADGPASPSISARLTGLSFSLYVALLIYVMGL